MVNAVGGRIAAGAAWMVAARFADRLIGLVATVVLARLLTPSDFGLVAMATSVVALIELASAFGFEMALVRKTNPSRDHYDTVWTLNVLFGLGCGGATCATAWSAAAYYGDDRLVAILLVLGASWAAGGLGNVGLVDYQRTLNFDMEFRFLIVRRLVGFLVTVTLALLLRSYWALIAGTVASRLAGLVLSYWWHPYRPRFSMRARNELFSFSAWVFVDKVVTFANTRSADFVLGRTHGPAQLGAYRLGEEIGHLPGTELVAPLNRALLPGVSQMVETGKVARELVAPVTGIMALALIPACLGISAIAHTVVALMLGTQWRAAAPVVEIMAINAAFVALSANLRTSLYAIGEARLPGLISLARLLVFAPSVFLLVPNHAAQGLATAALISSIIALIVGLTVGLRPLGVRPTEYLSAVWRPTMAAAGMWLAVRVAMGQISSPDSLFEQASVTVLMIGFGGIVYTVAVLVLYAAAGRPVGAEQLVIEHTCRVLRAMAGRPKK